MSTGHARLSASAAHRWLKCAGSVAASAGRETSSAYAAAGTFAHDIAASCLTNPKKSPSDWLTQKRKIDGFEVECDLEMVEAVRFYVDTIEELRRKEDKSWVEMPLLEPLQRIDQDLGGTADFVLYRAAESRLYVVDFKFGSGMYVEVDDNEQFKMYALGAMLGAKCTAADITVMIVQPRFEGAQPVRSWSFKAYEIMDFIADVQTAAVASRQPDAPLVAGDHCGFCPARRDCPELAKKQTALMANDFAEVTNYDPAALAEALGSIPLVKARIKAIEEFAYAEAVRGVGIPGYKLVDKRPTRQWIDEAKVLEWAQSNAVDALVAPSLLSPAQLEKRLGENAPRGKKKQAAEPIQKFIVGVSSGQTLVPITDDRKEVKKISEDDFAEVGQTADTREATPALNLFKE